jgi:hypothetical protein
MILSRRLLTAFLAPLLGLMLIGAPARAVEEPAFRLELKDGAFEIRDYPELVVAEVTVDGDQNTAGDRGFRILAGYIFGANHGQRHIAMTAPVSLTPPGEKIAMTAPVSQTRAGEAWTVRFTMPSAWRMDTLPQPNDSRISLHTVPPVRMADGRTVEPGSKSPAAPRRARVAGAVRSAMDPGFRTPQRSHGCGGPLAYFPIIPMITGT